MAYHRQQGVDTAIVRIFKHYGPLMRLNDGWAIHLPDQALAEKPLTVYGDGSQHELPLRRRPDRGLILLAESGEHLPVNIGNPWGVHDPRARRGRPRWRPVPERYRRGPAGRRPRGAAARHHARAQLLGWGADIGVMRTLVARLRLAWSTGACVGSARRSPRPLSASPSPSHRRPRRPGRRGWGSSTTASSSASRPRLPAAREYGTRARAQPVVGRAGISRGHPPADAPLRTTPPTTGTRRPHRAVRDRQWDAARLLHHRHASVGQCGERVDE